MPLNMQQNGLPITRNVLLVILVVVSLVLATVYAREGQDGPLHSVQNAVMGVTGPVGSVGAGLGSAVDASGDALQDATANPTTLSGLREQNEELRSLLASAEEYRQEADRLRGLLEMKEAAGVTGPVAHIIGRSGNAWDQSITIDLGTSSGVADGMTVMGATGVIGQVSHAFENTSTVRLLTDPNSGAAVMVQSSRANGIVRGSINGLMYLEDLDEEEIPKVGDIVVTSGLGGSYERGLLIGTITNVNKTETDSTGDILVTPNGDVSMLEEVIVVFKAPEIKADSSKSSESASKNAESADAQTGENGEAVEYDENGDPIAAEEGLEGEGSDAEDEGYAEDADGGSADGAEEAGEQTTGEEGA